MKHYGDYTDEQLKKMSLEELVLVIKNFQSEDNFIIMTDSYKMTHHWLLPPGLAEVYSYMESRGGEMPYTIFSLLQYYLMRYFAGVRITPDKIEEARQKNIAHFGFDCFNDVMWKHIWEKHGGCLPLEIKAIPEGLPVAVKNVQMTIRNTDYEYCAPLTNISETSLMKLWAPNTVAALARMIKELMLRYHTLSSDAPQWLIDFMHHDFGYRGVSSEESARILGAAALISFKGTDTLGATTLIDRYYGEYMAGFSVIASEHSVPCSYGDRREEVTSYSKIIKRIKKKCANVKPPSGVIILSLVSDTYNIYYVTKYILPRLKAEFINWTNNHGIPIKIVIRPDSGSPEEVLFGKANATATDELVIAVAKDMYYMEKEIIAGVSMKHMSELALELVQKGIFEILFEEFGVTVNSKGFRVLHPQIGVLQGDGVKYSVIEELYEVMIAKKIDTMNLVFGSGGKYLQAHDRDKQKYAIKCTHIKMFTDGNVEEEVTDYVYDLKGTITSINVEKNPVTDQGKKSKKGYLKLVRKQITDDPTKDWMNFETIQSWQPGFDEAIDVLVPVFKDGKILVEYDFATVRANAAIKTNELITT